MEMKKRNVAYAPVQGTESDVLDPTGRSPLRATIENIAWIIFGAVMVYYLDMWNITMNSHLISRLIIF